MIDPSLPLELDDGRAVTLVHTYDGGLVVTVKGAVVRPHYSSENAENDGLDEDTIEEYIENGRDPDSEEEWYYDRSTGIFDGGNRNGFFVLRNRYVDLEPCETEGFFV